MGKRQTLASCLGKNGKHVTTSCHAKDEAELHIARASVGQADGT
ncbi:hypothetical protein [Corynebacterium diphtheriae]|nr:hypothetical protein [Corynebacterium diphtheriae]